MSKTMQLIQRIEGEAKLSLSWERGHIQDAHIGFFNFRGYEKLLVGRPVEDAIVLTPRVCGICGQAHTVAAVQALEALYTTHAMSCEISPKAQAIRDICRWAEIIQSHAKWLYMTMLSDLTQWQDYQPLQGERWRIGQKIASLAGQISALFAGQYPHGTFAVVGGVVSDPTPMDIVQARYCLDDMRQLIEDEVFGRGWGSVRSGWRGDAARLCEVLLEKSCDHVGKGPGRYLILGEGKRFSRDVYTASEVKIKESDPQEGFAKVARYHGLPYETGPLARLTLHHAKEMKIDSSAFGRVTARLREMMELIESMHKALHVIRLDEPSYIAPRKPLKDLSGTGVSSVEAARGSLTHRVIAHHGKITSYDIITPTVWNLGDRDEKSLGICQGAIIGLASEELALIVLKSFDVCAVCTTH